MSESIFDKPDDFLASKTYPTAGPQSGLPPSMKRRGNAVRYALPAILFVGIVGIIAWVIQFTPNTRSTKSSHSAKADSTNTPSVIKFPFTRAVWDKDDEDYALEIERGKEGHFDFPFENLTGQPAEIGLLKTSCDCTHLDVCLVSDSEWQQHRQEMLQNPLAAQDGNWTWEKVTASETKGFEVPAFGKGLVRVAWNGRKSPGERLKLSVQVWHQPKGAVRERNFDTLEVPIQMAAPLVYTPARLNVGNLGPRDNFVAEFTLWSSTRDELDLKWGDGSGPLFAYDGRALTPEECRALEKKLRAERENTRVRKAYRLQVNIREQAAGKQMDQGAFQHTLSLNVDGEKIVGPQISGTVKGDIIIGNHEDRGKADFKIFRAKEGVTRTFPLWTDDKVTLVKESQVPATLEIKLNKEESAGNRAKWALEVTVPPNTQYGAFPDESVVILRVETTPPRFLRIPVVGNGQF